MRSRCTRSGRYASTASASISPPCVNPPHSLPNMSSATKHACTVSTVIPCSRCSKSAATPSGGMFSSCQFNMSRYFAPCCATEAQVSFTTFMYVSGESVIVPSNGMCNGVTPNGPPGSTNPSIRSATACAITFDAKISVPVGKCGPCCSTLPCGRITSGFFFNCAESPAASVPQNTGWQASALLSLRHSALRVLQNVRNRHALPVLFQRLQRGIYHRHRHIAVLRAQLIRLARPATLCEHFQFGAKHVALWHLQLFPLRVAINPALNVKRGFLVQLVRRVPRVEINLVMHQSLRPEHPHRENSRRGPAGANIADFSISEFQQSHGLVVHLGPDRRKFRSHPARFHHFAAQVVQHIKLVNRQLRKRPAGSLVLIPAPRFRRQFQRAIVRKIRFDERHPSKFPRVNRLPNLPDPRHQPRAVPHRYSDSVFFFQRRNLQPVHQRA